MAYAATPLRYESTLIPLRYDSYNPTTGEFWHPGAAEGEVSLRSEALVASGKRLMDDLPLSARGHENVGLCLQVDERIFDRPKHLHPGKRHIEEQHSHNMADLAFTDSVSPDEQEAMRAAIKKGLERRRCREGEHDILFRDRDTGQALPPEGQPPPPRQIGEAGTLIDPSLAPPFEEEMESLKRAMAMAAPKRGSGNFIFDMDAGGEEARKVERMMAESTNLVKRGPHEPPSAKSGLHGADLICSDGRKLGEDEGQRRHRKPPADNLQALRSDMAQLLREPRPELGRGGLLEDGSLQPIGALGAPARGETFGLIG